MAQPHPPTDPLIAEATGETNPWTSMLAPHCLETIRDAIRDADAANIPGALAEFGTHKGGTAKFMSLCSPSRRLFVFDTFAGLVEPDPIRDPKELTKGRFAADLTVAAPQFADLPITIVKGAFPQSAVGIDPVFAVVHLDMDLYHPTVAALRYVWDRMPVGGVIVLDDFHNTETPGIRDAVKEFGHPYAAPRWQAVIEKTAT